MLGNDIEERLASDRANPKKIIEPIESEQLTAPIPNVYLNTPILRKGLAINDKDKFLLIQKIPIELILAGATNNEDSFFDAIAQILNSINKTNNYSDKSLRMHCHKFYSQNKKLVDDWNNNESKKVDNTWDDYSFIQYTEAECDKYFNGRRPIQGRPDIEGKILCHQLKLKGLCFIEIRDKSDSQLPLLRYYLANEDTYAFVTAGNAIELMADFKIPKIVFVRNNTHYVPLLEKILKWWQLEFINNTISQTLTMICTTGGSFIGVIFVSKLGYTALAANNYVTTLQAFTIIPLNSTITYFSNRSKDGSPEAHIQNFRISSLSGWLSTAPTALIMWSVLPILNYISQDKKAIEDLGRYILYFTPGIPAMFLLNAYRQYLLAIKSGWFNVLFYSLYQVLDTELSYLLVFGKFSLPNMGLAGLGLSNSVATWTTVILFRLFLYKKFKVTFELPDISLFNKTLDKIKTHYLYGLRIFIDQGFLFSTSLMLGKMGAIQQAAQEAAYQYIPIFSTLIYGLKDSIGKMVGSSMVNQNHQKSNMITYVGITYGLVVTGIPFIAYIVWPQPLLKIFLRNEENATQNYDQVMQLASQLLWINGLGLMLDSVRNNCISALVSSIDKDEKASSYLKNFPLILILTALLVGLPLAYVLGFHTNLEAIGLMIARDIIIGLGTIASLGTFLLYNFKTNDNTQNNTSLPAPTAPTLSINDQSQNNNSSNSNWWNNTLSFFNCGKINKELVNNNHSDENTPLISKNKNLSYIV